MLLTEYEGPTVTATTYTSVRTAGVNCPCPTERLQYKRHEDPGHPSALVSQWSVSLSKVVMNLCSRYTSEPNPGVNSDFALHSTCDVAKSGSLVRMQE